MNSFSVDIDLPVSIYNSPVNNANFGSEIFHRKADNISGHFLDFLHGHKLNIRLAEVFYMPPFSSLKIHEDGGDNQNVLKLNWVIGGNDSLMHWYESISDPVWQETALGIRYRSYTDDSVRLIHSSKIGYPSLVQVGIPHNVTTNKESRYCISVMPEHAGNRNLLTFSEGLSLFNKYMK